MLCASKRAVSDKNAVRHGRRLGVWVLSKQLSKRAPALDGVRAVAVLSVIGFHAAMPGFTGGDSGVIAFFVLSGFLITTLLVNGSALGATGLLRFYARRALRLYPALLVVLAVTVLWTLIHFRGAARSAQLWQAFAAVTYIEDLVLGARRNISDFGLLGHTWSLSVEEQYYLVWPLLLIVAARLRWTAGTRAVASLVLTAIAFGWCTYLSSVGLHERVGLDIDGNAESLLVGCTLALSLVAWPEAAVRQRRTIGACGILGALVYVAIVFTNYNLPLDTRRMAIALSAASIICSLFLFPGRVAHLIGARPLAYLGLISYGLYLWHPLILAIFKEEFGVTTLKQRMLFGPVAMLIVLGVSSASYTWIERPFLKLKDNIRGGPYGKKSLE
jgi:peptidoglycan/LPS O-acetylase OafA/YrhL